MPYERPGAGVYVTATKATPHNGPATENGLVGIAVKQKTISWTAAFSEHQTPTIAIGEQFHIRTKGIRQVSTAGQGPGFSAAAKGTAVYIRPADNSLRVEPDAATTDIPFGRIVEVVADNRGVPAGKVRIDLDQKDTIIPAV
jgi:hypothetical protein